MTKEQAINYLRSSGFSEEQIQEIVKALEQEPCDDAVSRKEVQKEFVEWMNSSEDYYEHPVRFIRSLMSLPDVTLIRPKGHWINKHRLFDSCSAECSSCHKRSNGYMHDNGFGLVSTYYDFCPKCGSDNREVEE